MRNRSPNSRARRGQALLISLALILGLTVLVAATQLQSVVQLGETRNQRDYERALQYAEAGLNAYVNMLGNGAGSGQYLSAAADATVPPFASFGNQPTDLPTLDEFRADVRNGTYNASSKPRFIAFPPGSTDSGFCVGHVGTPGAFVTIGSYGYCRGAVRRIRADAIGFSVFDWAALWGINPSPTGWAWDLSGDFTVVGAFGGEGRMTYGNNNAFYDGPGILCTSAAAFFTSNGTPLPDPPLFGPSAPDSPPGHLGYGVMASPQYKRFIRRLDLPTADVAANDWAAAIGWPVQGTGVNNFRNNNNNATGLRYLVWQNGNLNTIRELNDPARPYTVMTPGTFALRSNAEWNPKQADLETWGMNQDGHVGESFYGIRVHPGNYYFERIGMGPSDRLLLRSYTDAERSSAIVQAARAPTIQGDPPNANGLATEPNIRFWIRNDQTGQTQETRFEGGTVMEYPGHWDPMNATRWVGKASRFRVYAACRETVKAHGSQSSPLNFHVNMLAYNQRPDVNNGNPYGGIEFQSGVYLRGSLLAWTVRSTGGATVEKEVPELGPGDLLTYIINKWTELP